MEIAVGLEPAAHQTMTAQMIEATQILTLSTMELDQRIMAEIESNPALELLDTATCARCGGSLEGSFCPACRLDQQAATPATLPDDSLPSPTSTLADGDDDFDPMTLVASETSLVDRVMSDLSTLIDAADMRVAEYILNSLDERGFLEAPVEEIAEILGRPVAVVEAVLRAVQAVAPVGVAARDVRECLLLQLDHLTKQAAQPVHHLARRLIADHLDDLAAHRYSRIARRLGATTGEIWEVHGFIRRSLNPYPAQSQETRWWKTPLRSPVVAPDVVVHYTDDGGFQIEIIESRTARIRLDPLYTSLVADVNQPGGLYSSEDRSHVRRCVSRAKFFLFAIQQRQETLKRITACLLEVQRDFVLRGVRELRPLTRCMVAERVGVHESTVSRATANKYLMLPNREVIPFSTFFTASLSIKDVIKELIGQEQAALTDEEIGERLQQQGIRIARRTVAKYRSTLGILPSTLRQGPLAQHDD